MGAPKAAVSGTICAHEPCNAVTPGDARTKYCSQLCRGRAKTARIKADPHMLAMRVASMKTAAATSHIKNRERDNEISRLYYWNNLEASRASARARYHLDPQSAILRKRTWIADNREHVRARMRDYYAENKVAYASYSLKRRAAHVKWGAVQLITPEMLAGKLAYWGSSCWMCRNPFQAWDHVKPIAKGGPHLLCNLRPSCNRCNSRKSAKWLGSARLAEIVAQSIAA